MKVRHPRLRLDKPSAWFAATFITRGVLRADMAFTRDGVIHASPERVFSVISDLDQTRQWMPAIERIDVVTPGPFRQGTVWRETRNAGKRTLESTIRVTGFEKPSRLDLEVESRPMKGQISFRLTPKEESTAVHYEAQMQGRGLMRLMSGMMNRMMAEADNHIIDRLKHHVEERA